MGTTALQLACKGGEIDVVTLLLARTADASATDCDVEESHANVVAHLAAFSEVPAEVVQVNNSLIAARVAAKAMRHRTDERERCHMYYSNKMILESLQQERASTQKIRQERQAKMALLDVVSQQQQSYIALEVTVDRQKKRGQDLQATLAQERMQGDAERTSQQPRSEHSKVIVQGNAEKKLERAQKLFDEEKRQLQEHAAIEQRGLLERLATEAAATGR
jgi:hypothetical protein